MDAGVAQLVEQRICNAQVAGSSPFASSIADQDRDRTEKCIRGVARVAKGGGL